MIIGTRVKLIKDVENYPTIYAKAGLIGKLESIDDDSIWVKLERHFDELNEWQNSLQIWDHSDTNDNDPECKPFTFIEAIPTRYVVRDKATKGTDFLMWGDNDPDAAQVTLRQCNTDGLDVELVTMAPDKMDSHTKRLIEGEKK